MQQRLRLVFIVTASIAVAWVFVSAIRFSVLDFARVTNESMLPHLKPGQVVAILKLTPCLKLPFSAVRFFCSPCETGHAYIFSSPSRPQQKLVKFAVAPPSPLKRDIIWFTQHRPIAAETQATGTTCYFEGSNREYSVDSRHFGAVPVEEIDGKVVYPGIFLNR